MYYPKSVYSINETVTRARMKEYDKRQREIEKMCEEICPEYHKLNLLERRKVWEQAEEAYEESRVS